MRTYKGRTFDCVVAMAARGDAPAAIAAAAGCSAQTVYHYAWAARRMGHQIPARLPSSARLGLPRLPRDIAAQLGRAAARRGVTAERLARDILEAVIADDLIDAVLDDGADTPSPTEGDKR
jgi:hypothetical protein